MNKLIDRLKHLSLLETVLIFTVITLASILIPVMLTNMDEEQLRYVMLQQRQQDLEQLIKDHPDHWWYKTDLNMTNELLGLFKKNG